MQPTRGCARPSPHSCCICPGVLLPADRFFQMWGQWQVSGWGGGGSITVVAWCFWGRCLSRTGGLCRGSHFGRVQGAKALHTPHSTSGLWWDIPARPWALVAVRKLCPGGVGCACPGQFESCSSSGGGGPESALSRHLLAGFDSPFSPPICFIYPRSIEG